MVVHFGCEVRTEEVRLTKENYINKSDEFERFYYGLKSDLFANMDERVEFRKKQALINYDLNMAYYRSLDSKEFIKFVEDKIVNNPAFNEVKNLNDYKCPGVYVMVLDEYKQVYVGISDNVKRRIQTHWSIKKDLFRLIFFGGMTGSKMSIDAFRALDTTRIFVCTDQSTQNELWAEENKLVDSLPDCYLCNRMLGGNPYEQIKKNECFKSAELPKVTKDNINDILPDYSWEQYCLFLDFTMREQKDRRKGFAIREQEEEERRQEWIKKQEEINRIDEENKILREKQTKELERLGFNPKEDFPDYYNEYVGNAFVIYDTIMESIDKGFDISIYKGLKSLDIQKVFVCLDNGIPQEEAIDYADSYGRLMYLKESFKPKNKNRKKKGKKKTS